MGDERDHGNWQLNLYAASIIHGPSWLGSWFSHCVVSALQKTDTQFSKNYILKKKKKTYLYGQCVDVIRYIESLRLLTDAESIELYLRTVASNAR